MEHTTIPQQREKAIRTDLSIFLQKYFCRRKCTLVILTAQCCGCDGMHPESCSVDSVYPIQSVSRHHQYPQDKRVNDILTVKEGDCKPTMNTMRQKIIRPAPSEISYKEMRFLITDRPTDQTITNFIEELKKHNVLDVVRVCEPTYKVEELRKEGIDVTDLVFDDGTFPPTEIVEQWFDLLRRRFGADPSSCVAVHCVAGLGRAPVLVALALIELGMKYEDAVELIREKRRGAINSKQLAYLEKYRPKSRLKFPKIRNGHAKNGCCMQ